MLCFYSCRGSRRVAEQRFECGSIWMTTHYPDRHTVPLTKHPDRYAVLDGFSFLSSTRSPTFISILE